MGHHLHITQELHNKLNRIDFTEQVWLNIGVNNFIDLKAAILDKINTYNSKLMVKDIIISDPGERSENYATLQNIGDNNINGYVFFIPPLSDSRSGFLAQHVYPAHTTIINSSILSNCMEPFNKPVYIVNVNEFKITNSKRINIRGAITIGFKYLDVLNRDIPKKYSDLFELDRELKQVNELNENQYFEIDSNNKSIVLKANTLGSGTNDRYFFSAKGYPALYLASVMKFKVDSTNFATNPSTNNITIQALISYANKLNTIL